MAPARGESGSEWSEVDMETESGDELQQLRAKLAQQLKDLKEAIPDVSAEVAEGSCSSSCAHPSPPASAEPVLDFLTLREHYEQALDQARELYALTDPEVTEKAVEEAATEAAEKEVLAEAVRLQREVPRKSWPDGWAMVMDRALACYTADQGKSLQVDAAVRSLPSARRTRTARRRTTTSTTSTANPDREEKKQEPKGKPVKEDAAATQHLNKWQALVARIQGKRRWSARGQLANSAANGCPRSIDGPARVFGRHVGRWQWREIAFGW